MPSLTADEELYAPQNTHDEELQEQGVLTVYLAGPMNGYPDYNAVAFQEATDVLRARGFTVMSPYEMDVLTGIQSEDAPPGSWEWTTVLARDLRLICQEADAIVVLPGYQESRGCYLEVAVAQALNIQVLQYPVLVRVRL